MSLKNIKSQIRKVIEFDPIEESSNIVHENAQFLIELLKGQLAKGQDKDGNPVTVFGRPYYSDRTVFHKSHARGVPALGKETRWITNFMTGSFYSSIYLFETSNEFVFDSSVPYFSNIMLQSGENIMKLNQQNIDIFTEKILLPELKRRYETWKNGV